MKLKLKPNEEQTKLIRAMGSHDEDISRKAVKIFAKLVGEVAQTVLPESNIIDSFYETLNVGEFDPRTIALDDFHDEQNPDHVRVTFSSKPGDLSSSLITGSDEFSLQFFNIAGAVSMMKKYLRAGQINHAEKAINRLLAEVTYKFKVQGIQPILQSIAQATVNSNYNVLRTSTANQFGLSDFNRLKTLASRQIVSGLGKSTTDARGINLLLMSPEVMQEIRSIAYEPQNTRGAPNSDESTAIPAPDSVRQQIYTSAGNPSLFNVDLVEVNELGIGYEWNTIFDSFAGVLEYPDAGEAVGSANTSVFNGTTEELVIGLSLAGGTAQGLVKAGIVDDGSTTDFVVRPDTIFLDAEEKVGMRGTAQRSYLSVEPRSLYGMIV